MTTSGHMMKLVELARAKSSDTRRKLLHEITDLFLDEPAMRAGEAGTLSDDIITQIAEDMDEAVREELSERFADVADAPKGLVRTLALDSAFCVARPVLERSDALDEQALIDVALQRGPDHLNAIAARPLVTEAVSEAVVARGEESAMVTLTRNPRARLSRRAFETLVDRAENAETLQQPLVERAETPPDLLNEMYFFVGRGLRERIMERGAQMSPDELERAVAAARERMARRGASAPGDFDDAVKFVQVKKLRKQLTGKLLQELLQRGAWTKFLVAFADLASIDFTAARRVIDAHAIDPLAIACKAAGFERDLFVALAMLRPSAKERAISDVDALGEVYDELPIDAAERVMRFWRLRRDASMAA